VNGQINQGTDKQKAGAPKDREADAIYQNDRLVARVTGAEADLAAKQIRFAEVYNSDELLLPEECEFQKYRMLIQRIADATKVSREEPHKGRILRGVVADLLGHREQ
jgi:hypothetical protein